MSHGAFIYTSNVDGHFQRAGFAPEEVHEVHGSIDWMQCTRGCGVGLFSAGAVWVDIEETTMRAREPLPACPSCGALARPNILLFDDGDWDFTRSYEQEVRLNAWLAGPASPNWRHTIPAHMANTARLTSTAR